MVMKWLMNLMSSDVTEPQHYGSPCVYKAGWRVRQELETADVQGSLACLMCLYAWLERFLDNIILMCLHLWHLLL